MDPRIKARERADVLCFVEMQLLLFIVIVLLFWCVMIFRRIMQHAQITAQLAERLYSDTSALFPCYPAATIALTNAAVDRAFAAYQATEWSDDAWEAADIANRVEMMIKRVHVGRIWNISVKHRDFQLQANIDVLRGARSIADVRAEERRLFENPFEVIVPAAIRQAISDVVTNKSEWPSTVEKYESGDNWQ